MGPLAKRLRHDRHQGETLLSCAPSWLLVVAMVIFPQDAQAEIAIQLWHKICAQKHVGRLSLPPGAASAEPSRLDQSI
jgi:hypothetical protein